MQFRQKVGFCFVFYFLGAFFWEFFRHLFVFRSYNLRVLCLPTSSVYNFVFFKESCASCYFLTSWELFSAFGCNFPASNHGGSGKRAQIETWEIAWYARLARLQMLDIFQFFCSSCFCWHLESEFDLIFFPLGLLTESRSRTGLRVASGQDEATSARRRNADSGGRTHPTNSGSRARNYEEREGAGRQSPSTGRSREIQVNMIKRFQAWMNFSF